MAIGSPQWMYKSGEAYELEQSLRFNDDDSAYLSKTFASAGNRRTWTWSAWIKRSNSSATHMLFFTAVAGDLTEDDHFGIRLDSGASSNIILTWGDGNTAVTNAIFRDPSAWMHIVVAIDTTQGTDTNRVKVYVNGTQQTFSSTDLPSQNFEYGINKAQEHNIGSRVIYGSSANYYDGYLAEVNFIDGQALTPADFGETGTYGEWKPIEYSGTYGTNGFYLPFKQDYTVEGFSTTLYKGSGGTNSLTVGGVGFSPSLVWLKNREANNNGHHFLFDKLRGTSLTALRTNVTNAEGFPNPAYDRFTRFDNDGFSMIGGQFNAAYINSAQPYVAWSWDMGAATPTGFGCVTYDGTQRNLGVGGMNFSPDLVWIKRRNAAAEHFLIDKVRGSRKILNPDGTGAELDRSYFRSFDPDGFTLEPSVSNSNNQGDTYVAWGWDMGGTTATNTSGGITSTVMANTTYGQSIVSFTGTGSSSTVGHGLTSAPEVVLVMNRDIVHNPSMWHTSIPNTHYLHLDNTAASAQNTAYWSSTSPTNQVFTVGTSADVNGSSNNMIAYCFHSVSGYSKFGSYTGNGSANGTTVTLGFRPAFLIIKSSTQAENWNVIDSTRTPLNGVNNARLQANTTTAEGATWEAEITDTGFQLKTTDGEVNANGETYIYMAFAGGMDSISDYNTDGSIDSRVKANTTYGQSIVSYVGTGSAMTVGHGLDSTPEMIIIKSRDRAENWFVYHEATGTGREIFLNNTLADAPNGNAMTAVNATTFASSGDTPNRSGDNHIAYCFHSVTGYSKFGSYTGNGSTQTISGLGFEPAWILIRRINADHDWVVLDNQRKQSGRTAPSTLRPNTDVNPSETNQNGDDISAFTSDGFTVGVNARVNGNGDTFIYAAFADTREYAYWLDQSGNNNDWTSNNLTESDISVDSPTNNFATMNPLDKDSNITLYEGNTRAYSTNSGGYACTSTISTDSGKWYAEINSLVLPASARVFVGWALNNYDDSISALDDFIIHNLGSFERYVALGSNYDSSSTSFAAGDILQLAWDMDAGKFWFGKNGNWVNSGNPSSGTNATVTSSSVDSVRVVYRVDAGAGTTGNVVFNFGQDSSFAGNKTAQANQDSNDIGDFYYTPPTGFLALCTKNLPDVAVTPSEHFNTVLWTGDGGSDRAVTGVNFEPNFVWIKSRSITGYGLLFDAVRGANKKLYSSLTNAEFSDTDALLSFEADGFNVGDDNGTNQNSATYVAWNWKANGSGSSNTDGSITSTVSANTDAGFSIVSYTGTGSNATVGHGLSKAPEMMIVKDRDQAMHWFVYHTGLTNANYSLKLDNTQAQSNDSTKWNGTDPTSSVFSIGTEIGVNQSSNKYIGYMFHSVDGYSSVGSYVGNDNADGTFVYTGFRVAFLLLKNINLSGEGFVIMNNKSDPANPTGTYLTVYSTAAEQGTAGTTFSRSIDFLSNGFKLRGNSTEINDGDTMIFYAVAETPFKNSNAR